MITPSVVWKYLCSFFKQEWSAEDYPMRVRHLGSSAADHTARWKPVRVDAAVINWWQMSGGGETEAEAVKDLAIKLEARKARGERLPRPGTGLPIEFAASGRVEAHHRLAADRCQTHRRLIAVEWRRFESKWADDVAEAYHADYVGTSGGPVLVSAVRFKDANHAIDKPPGLGAQRSLSTRFVLGAMAIRVSGSSNLECFQAVSKYLQSLR